MSAKAIKAGQAYVEIATKNNMLVRGLAAAAKHLRTFGAAVTGIGLKVAGIGVALAAPFLAANKIFADIGGQLADMSQRTGVSVEALSELGFAAEQSGADLETLEGSIKKMQKLIVSVAEGNKEAADTLDRLGLSLEDLKGLSPDEQFVTIADAISKIKDPALRTSSAMAVFGKSGTKLLPMFADGAKGINELTAQARALGLTWDTETAQGAEAFGDSVDIVFKQIKKFAAEIGGALLPDLKTLASLASDVATKSIAWVKANQEIIATVFRIVAGVVAAGVALVALGAVFSGIGAAIGAALTVLAGIGTTVSTVIGAVGAVIGALLSPIGLVAAAVVGLGGYFLYASGIAGSVVEYISQVFSILADELGASFGAIGNALASGDIAAAAAVLWSLLKMEWKKGTNFLNTIWEGWKTSFLDVWNAAITFIAKGWIETIDGLADAWSFFAGFLTRTWNSTIGFIQKAWVRLKGLFVDIDVNAETSSIDDATKQANAADQNARNKAVMDRENARKQAKRILDEEQARKARERADAEAADIAASQADVDAAKSEWQDAVKKANDAPAIALPAGPKAPGSDIPDTDELAGLAKKIDVKGTFNAAAVRGFGADTNIAEQQLNTQRRIEKNTREGRVTVFA